MGCYLLFCVLLLNLLIFIDCSAGNSCSDSCSPASNGSALCRCDADCQYYGDCCGTSSPPASCPPSNLPPLQAGVEMECRSAFIDLGIQVSADGEAYFMISSCPSIWMDPDNSSISRECSNLSSDKPLPHVTDTTTGLVYKNEFCARCNGVKDLVAWEMSLSCNAGVYERLNSTTIVNLLQEDPHVFKNNCSECSFRPPKAPNILPRSCISNINYCMSQSVLESITFVPTDDSQYNQWVEDCRTGPLNLVIDSYGEIYRNADCARCNAEENPAPLHLDSGATSCVPTIDRPSAEAPPIFTFTITLSNLGRGQVTVSVDGDRGSIPVNCPDGEVPVGLDCRQTQCPEGYSVTGGRCSFAGPSFAIPSTGATELSLNTTTSASNHSCFTGIMVVNSSEYYDFGNGTILLEGNTTAVNVLHYDEQGRPVVCAPDKSSQELFINCSSQLVVLDESEYVEIGNDSIRYGTLIIEVKYWDKEGRPLVCPDQLSSAGVTRQPSGILYTPLPGIEELTYVGCSLSVLGTIAVLVTYFIFSELHTFPGLVLMNLCVTILATNLLFITGGPTIQSYPLVELCSTLAITLHFFYLAQFAWMSIFSCEVLRNFYQARQFSQDSKRTKNRFFAIYLIFGWLPPLTISTITIALNFSVDGLILYGVDDQGQLGMCWINHFKSFAVTFLLPLIISLSCNLLMLVITTALLCRASRDQSKLEKPQNNTIIRVWLAAFSITGLTWIFGFFAISKSMSWMWYPFVIFNSAQGFGIFLAFIFTRKVFNLYVELLTGKRRRKNTLSFRNRSNASIRSNSSSSMHRRNTESFKTSGSFKAKGSFKTHGSLKTNGTFKASKTAKPNGSLSNGTFNTTAVTLNNNEILKNAIV